MRHTAPAGIFTVPMTRFTTTSTAMATSSPTSFMLFVPVVLDIRVFLLLRRKVTPFSLEKDNFRSFLFFVRQKNANFAMPFDLRKYDFW